MRVALDLRGLNYRSFTGINNYTLRLLKHLPVRSGQVAIEYTCLGLTAEARSHLCTLLPRYKDAEFLSMAQYYHSPLHRHGTLSSALSVLAQRRTSFSKAYEYFDYLLLPQPKAIQLHPKTRLVTVFHDLFGVRHPEFMSPRHRLVENLGIYKRLGEASYRCLVNSYATGCDLEKYAGVDAEKITLNYPADLNPDLPDDLPRLHPRPYFLAVSAIEPRKNWLNLIAAYQTFAVDNSGTDLILLGHPVSAKYLHEVRTAIASHPNIYLYLEVNELTKARYLRHAKALLYPSFYEGFGFPILEAHRYGVPVVTSRVSSMPEIAGAGATYVNPFRVEEITAALNILTDDEKYHHSLQGNARRNYICFGWGNFEVGLSSTLTER